MIYEHWSNSRKARAVRQMSDYLLTHCYSTYSTWKKYCPYWEKEMTEEEYSESILKFVSVQGNFENALFVFYCLVT